LRLNEAGLAKKAAEKRKQVGGDFSKLMPKFDGKAP
jgi:hypothetical protein